MSAPPPDDAAMDAEVLRMADAGDVRGLLSMAYGGGPCACLGPRDGAPACPCEMARRAGVFRRRWDAVARHVVPYFLNKGRIVRRRAPQLPSA